MIVIIQCAAKKQPDAGSLHTHKGQPVYFVGQPECAPNDGNRTYARPDDASGSGPSWRDLLVKYNAHPGDNPLGLYPAYALYHNPTYQRLVDRFGLDKVFILSAGWGLIAASFLTPTYDITFSPAADAYKRRGKKDVFRDFSMLPDNSGEEIFYFGGKNYIPQFCRLTSTHQGERTVFYNSATQPQAPGCVLSRYETTTRTNWHYECAKAFISTPSKDSLGGEVSAAPKPKLQASVLSKSIPHANRSSSPKPLYMDDDTVREAVRSARKGIAQYLWLIRSLQDTDVSANRDFQRRYNGFYRVRQRSPDWYFVYFNLLESRKLAGTEFGEILDAIWNRLGRYEPSFSSKLVATIDPTKPIWDRFVLMNTGVSAPPYNDPKKMTLAKAAYGQISDWYATHLDSEAGQRMVRIFDEVIPEHGEVSRLKKLDFILWQTR